MQYKWLQQYENPAPFFKSPTGIAVLVGAGVVLAGGVIYAATRGGHSGGAASLPTCAWTSVDVSALAKPGHYRIDVGINPAQVTNYPATEQAWEALISSLTNQIPPGMTIEGIWLSKYKTQGPYGYPFNSALPNDWPSSQDLLFHIDIQLLWPYASDIAALSLNKIVSMLSQNGASIAVWSCPTGPVPPAQPIPFKWTPIQATNGSVSIPAMSLFLLSTPVPQAPSFGVIGNVTSALQRAGLTVEAALDQSTIPGDWPSNDRDPNRWRFIVANATTSPISLQQISASENVYGLSIPGLS